MSTKMIGDNHISFSLIVDHQAVSSRPAGGTVVTPANLPLGTVALVDERKQVLTAMPTTGKVAFAKGNGSTKQLTISPYFNVADATYTKQKHIVAAEQVTYIGYIGSGTANVPNVNDTEYHIIISKRDNDERNRMGRMPDITANFRTSTASSVKEWAHGMAGALAKNITKEIPNKDIVGNGPSYIKVSIVQNGTAVAVVPTGTAVYNSKYVTLSAAVAGFAVGDTITVGGDTYLVAANSGTLLTLNNPFRGNSASALALAEITAGTDTLYGLKIEGVANEFGVSDFRNYFKNRFDVLVRKQDLPSGLTITQAVKPYEGIGTWQSAKIAERLMKHTTLVRRSVVEMPINEEIYETEVASGDAFSIVSVNIETTVKEFIGTARVKAQIHLYLQLDGSLDLVAGSQGDQLAETVLGTAFATGDLDA